MRTAVASIAMLCVVVAVPASAQRFRRPVACSDCISNWFYLDEDRAAGAILDWSCGASTYDGHRGSDFSLRGGIPAIANGYDVVAAADGMVVTATDGFYDRCTSCPAAGADPRCGLGFGGGFGNYVVIDHGGVRTIYAHMRTGSVRVRPGMSVRCGEVLGQIGSSGCTTGAHLHFEVRTGTGSVTAVDPFMGRCGATTSRWVEQGAHRDLPGATCDGTRPCPDGWYDLWTCEGSTRRRCVDGVTRVEDCAPGRCVSRPIGTDDACDADLDGVATDEGDCDDRDPAVQPGGVERCGNGLDDDCRDGDLACPDLGALDAGSPAPPDGGLDDVRGDAAPTPASCGCSVRGRRPPWLVIGFSALVFRRSCSRRRGRRLRPFDPR